jgi:hypothetical protein
VPLAEGLDWAPGLPAASPAWPPAVAAGGFGRGEAPVRMTPVDTAGALPWEPVVVHRVWGVPDRDEALAVVSGTVGDRWVTELIDVDAGAIRWHVGDCEAPVVHVTGSTVVCADARGAVGMALDTGAITWRHAIDFGGAEGALVVGAAGDRAVVIDADAGAVIAEVTPPAPVAATEVHRACRVDGGVELWAWSSRIGILQITAAGQAHLLPIAAPVRADTCAELVLVEAASGDRVERDLYTVTRGAGGAPPAIAGGPLPIRGQWRGAAPGEVVTATADGIERRDAALALIRRTSDAQVGRSLSARGARRLVRGAAGLPILLEDDAPLAYLSAPSHADSAVLGDRAVLGGGWQSPLSSLADRPQRWLLPARFDDAPVIPPLVPRGVPELPIISRDLPDEIAADPALQLDGAGAHDVGVVFVDPVDPSQVYAVALEAQPTTSSGAGLAALDVRDRRWRWHAPQGCPPGTPIAVAAAAEVIACGGRAPIPGHGAVRAVGKQDGAIRWTWTGETVDAVLAAGGVVAVLVGRDALLLDAATGERLGLVAAEDGFVPRVLPIAVDGTDLIVTVERGALVARLVRAGMLPVWATAVRGAVVALGTAGDRLSVELASGELYLIDPASGAAVAASAWGQRWRPLGDLVLVEPVVPVGTEWQLFAYGPDGAPRFASGLAVAPPWLVGARGEDPAAPLTLSYGPAARAVAVVDAATGEVRARVALPPRAVPGATFATVVDGAPVAGAVLSKPLGVVLF